MTHDHDLAAIVLALKIQYLANQMIRLDILTRGCVLAFMEARFSLMEQIRAHQFDDAALRSIRDKVLSGKDKEGSLDSDGVLRIGG